MQKISAHDVMNILNKFHVSNAEAFFEKDRLAILADIEKTIGGDHMTAQIRKFVKDAFVKRYDAGNTGELTAGLSDRAVSFSFLKEFSKTIPENYTMGDIVNNVILPATMEKKCHYTAVIT